MLSDAVWPKFGLFGFGRWNCAHSVHLPHDSVDGGRCRQWFACVSIVFSACLSTSTGQNLIVKQLGQCWTLFGLAPFGYRKYDDGRPIQASLPADFVKLSLCMPLSTWTSISTSGSVHHNKLGSKKKIGHPNSSFSLFLSLLKHCLHCSFAQCRLCICHFVSFSGERKNNFWPECPFFFSNYHGWWIIKSVCPKLIA